MSGQQPSLSARTAALRAQVLSAPLDALDVSDFDLYEHDVAGAAFERLRREAPVHYCPASPYGPYWSITRFEDVRAVEIDHQRFSSRGSVTLKDEPYGSDFETPSFITMDPPEHDLQRAAVQPAVAPRNLRNLEPTIRARAAAILDDLPVGEPFDWVDRVAIELTIQMLATLFDFPFDERRRLRRWSDVAVSGRATGTVESNEERKRELEECLSCFLELWRERAAAPPRHDLLSMLAHAEATKDMAERRLELLGNVILLIVGGNDTTRNSITGGVLALNRHPEQYDALRADPKRVENLVHEIIRWQTPVIHQRRTATEDVEIGGRTIRKGDKVAMWYLSANRDEAVFPDGERLWVERPNAKHHLSFGFGIHRCMGAHLAEMQLRVLWEEILPRFSAVEVLEEPTRQRSNFLRAFTRMPVRLHPR